MKGRGLHITDSAFYKIAFAFSVLMLVVIAIISFRQLQAINTSQNKIIKSHDREIELQKLFSIIKDAERMQRGYLLSGHPYYYKEYGKSRSRLNKSIECLKSLADNKSLKKGEVDSLRLFINRRMDNMDKTLSLNRSQMTSPQTTELLNQGASDMRKIEALVNRIVVSEKEALHKHEAFHAAKNRALPYITALLVIFALLIFVISFYKISRDSSKLRKMNNDLIIINRSFQYAEEISEMGHWKRNLNNDTIIPSDNLYRLFGYEPNTFEFTDENILEVVHPDDRHILIESLKHVEHHHYAPSITYRIIRPNGQIRYFRSAGKVLSINNQSLVLGATFDITHLVEVNLSLENKNAELEAAVEELASFNHIASHDLQEPLRKIQMFISRIAVEEAGALSDTGKEYFERVNASALRMEQLIDDLLLYSETNKSEQNFEDTDLNVILAETVHELNTEIDERNAEIIWKDLPEVRAIPFQMRQMFINLISNALKYSRTGVKPQVTITCNVVSRNDVLSQKPLPSPEYYHITVKDNGIGFQQEFAEKIFVLFQRLHKKENYSGTGIGLSICRKILENHFGLISAESNPGEGATFHVYLPR